MNTLCQFSIQGNHLILMIRRTTHYLVVIVVVVVLVVVAVVVHAIVLGIGYWDWDTLVHQHRCCFNAGEPRAHSPPLYLRHSRWGGVQA